MHKETYKKYKKQFVTSDIHLNHSNIPNYCPDTRGQFINQVGQNADGSPIYKNRIDEMNETIITNWNSTVSPDDHTFIIGDVAMGLIDKAPALIRRLNGHKTLIRGNHDKKLSTHPEINDLFISVVDYLAFNVQGTLVVMSHFPFACWDRQYHGAVALHGHIHSPAHKVFTSPGNRIMDVGMDGHNLFPRELEATVNYIVKTVPPPTTDHHGDAV